MEGSAVADIHEGGTFEAEREALRSALRFPDPLAKTEGLSLGKRPSASLPRRSQDNDQGSVPVLPPPPDAQLRWRHQADSSSPSPDTQLQWRQQADSSSPDMDDVLLLLDVIAATVEHLSSSVTELIERVEQLSKRLGAFDRAAEHR
jgi:hypothetical protein